MRATLEQELRAALRDPNPGAPPLQRAKPYVAAIAAVGVATLLKWSVTEAGVGNYAAFLFYWPTVFLAAFYGSRIGIFASLLGAVLGAYFFVGEGRGFEIDATTTVNATLYFLESSAVCLFISGLRGNVGIRKDRETQLHLFAEVGRTLARRNGFTESLQAASDLAIGTFAELAAIDLLTPDGGVERATVSMMPGFPEATREGLAAARVNLDSPTDPTAIVLRSGEPFFIQEVKNMRAVSRTADHEKALNSVQVISSMVLPLADRRHLWGTIAFARTTRMPRYSYADFLFGQELANRIATHLERLQLLDELAQANRAKDDFLGVLSHEMRSPITVIKGGVDLLIDAESPLSEDQRDQLMRTVRAEAERLGTLFDNLLALATGADNAPLELEPSSLNGFLTEFVPVLGERLGESRITVKTEGRLPLVDVVPSYVEQILRNLLTNAQKYSPPDTPIVVEARMPDDTCVCISVTDQGPGVPEDELERIFTPYYRTPDGKRKAAGFGVGLGVARQLAQLMGGNLHAELPPDGGFRVILTLPAIPPQAEV